MATDPLPSQNGLDYGQGPPVGANLPNPFTSGSRVDLGEGKSRSPISISADGFIKIERPDGSVTIDTNPNRDDYQSQIDTKHSDNLAEHMDDFELAQLSAELLEGIEADDRSRQEWLDTRAKGLQMLALKIEDPRTDIGNTSAPLEGMSTVRHSLMLEATVSFQAGARAELLPSKGPVKVKNVTPASAPQEADDSIAPTDELANALEVDFNHYLIDIAREYYPDHDRMFFQVGFGGDSFVKAYHCPLRRRPVLESIDAEDLIVSNAAVDLSSCGRVTHRVRMRKSVFRRMQLVGAYRDIDISIPMPQSSPDQVREQKAEIGGYQLEPPRPKDLDLEVYETYVELDLPRFSPKQFRGKGLPLPYKVTIETTSKKILEVRRNWKKEDKEAQARQVFVQFPFLRGVGFYGLGFVHLLGNTVQALTACYRLMIDAGMYANFPAFLYDKMAGRQLTNQFRAPLGGGIPLEVPPGKTIAQVASPLPYKEVGPAWPALVQHIEERGKQLAMVANSPVAEGKQDAPVGTTLALIEQNTKVEATAFKRLHAAMADEFRLLKELFLEDPEAMWRHAKQGPSGMQWKQAQFVQALQTYDLIPVSDPNTPSALHRAMKAAMLKMLAMQNPMAYDMVAVDKRVMSMTGIDPQGIFKPPQPQGPDPMMQAAQQMMQMRQQQTQLQLQMRQQEQQLKAATALLESQGRAADRASRERVEEMKAKLEDTKHQRDAIMERLKLNLDEIKHVHGLMQAEREGHLDQQRFEHERGMGAHKQKMDEGSQSLQGQQFGHQSAMDVAGHQREQAQFGHQQHMDQAGHALKEKQGNKPETKPSKDKKNE